MIRWHRARHSFAVVLMGVLPLAACAGLKRFDRDLRDLEHVHVVHHPSPRLKGASLGKTLLAAVGGGAIGLVALEGTTRRTGPEDFAALLGECFATHAQDVPGWPPTTVEPVPVERPPAGETVVELDVQRLYVGWLGLVHGGNGLMASTMATMYDGNGERLWRAQFTYYSGDYERSASNEQFEADGGRLLREEMSFAADRTAVALLDDLVGQR